LISGRSAKVGIESLQKLEDYSKLEAQILLRTLFNAPFDRSHLANAVRSGEFNGLHWRIVATPMVIDATPSGTQSWTPYRVAASVSFGAGQIVTAETVELAKSQ
jgi:hypothetical protein